MAFGRKRNMPSNIISLGDQVVEKCERVRDLGVILDSKLTFTDHYNTIINKASNMLSFIKRFCYNFQEPYTIKTLYNSYVRSGRKSIYRQSTSAPSGLLNVGR